MEKRVMNHSEDVVLVTFASPTEQDSRWGDAEKKLLRRTKFSKVLEQKVSFGMQPCSGMIHGTLPE